AEDGIRDFHVTGVQTCALPICAFEAARFENRDFARWVKNNVVAHKQPGYAIAVISLKPEGGVPGDATSDQMDLIADLADAYSAEIGRASCRERGWTTAVPVSAE